MPITGMVHQPPPVHQVFEGHNFVICNFVPRKVDYHPLSIPVPYYHSNVDSDEVMFYCGGDYEARKGSGIGQGSISLHPGGHSHGPQPGAYERSIGVDYFDELAVMVDTFRPLRLGEGGRASRRRQVRLVVEPRRVSRRLRHRAPALGVGASARTAGGSRRCASATTCSTSAASTPSCSPAARSTRSSPPARTVWARVRAEAPTR